MIDGKLQDQWLESEREDGAFIRKDSQFRHWITPDGAPGPSGKGGFKAESGRYHLYVSYACPWAHRTLIFRHLKQLTKHVSVSVVHPDMEAKGWKFADFPGATEDHINHRAFLYEIYRLADARYSGIVTVPVLWDIRQQTIVNNESSEIIRMFNAAFNGITHNRDDYYPIDLRDQIDEINRRIYDTVNNGVYACGFATRQAVYEKAFDALFDTLGFLEQRLSGQRYLLGDRLTETDLRLLPTLLRFDPVYYSHFKCNLHRIVDYPQLSGYMRDLYQIPGIRETFHLDHIKRHYYYSHESINPTRIIPKGPALDYDAPHDRNRFDKSD